MIMPEWMKELSKEENNKEFSELTHNYFKLANMRIMQVMREKYKIPPEHIPSLVLAIFSRMLNEACYAVGSNIKNDSPISSFFSKNHLLNLVKVLNGEALKREIRTDLDHDIEIGLIKFKEFIMKNASDFYVKD